METTLNSIVIKFAGDSGDGMQFIGSQFTYNTAIEGFNLETFPDYPAEIRAPAGTISGVSGFQIHFGDKNVKTPGDELDVLVAMNAAALAANLALVKKNGLIITNTAGFDKRNLSLAGLDESWDINTTSNRFDDFQLIKIDLTTLTSTALSQTDLDAKSKSKFRNVLALGLIVWLFERETTPIENAIKQFFANKEELAQYNIDVFRVGYNLGETLELSAQRKKVAKPQMSPGNYRYISGNEATALGLIVGAKKAGVQLFYGSYPITPASDILHYIAKNQRYGALSFQAEDEIAAICAAIGASFGGNLGATGTSGPGMALKTEAIGLAISLELPLVICNVQRGGPSTGLPTKTEQADLLQAIYGRNGESPLCVIAPATVTDCFTLAYEACRIAIEYMCPVVYLSDLYLANSSEPWKYPQFDELPPIQINESSNELPFMPYKRNSKNARAWVAPGKKDFEHRLGGLEKEDETGNVSYNPQNHEKMIKIRAAKIAGIENGIPSLQFDYKATKNDVLLIGWGSTHGAISLATQMLNEKDDCVSHLHLRYLNPFNKELKEVIGKYKMVVVAELNNGQLVKILRDKFLVNCKSVNKIQGKPFTAKEICNAVNELIQNEPYVAG